MSSASLAYIPDEDLERFILEDCPYGDLTTHLLGIGDEPGRILFTTRHETVLCGTEEAARLLEKVGCKIETCLPSGTLAASDVRFLQAIGPASSLHIGWKTAASLVEWPSGIATRTRAVVEKAKAVNPSVAVVTTRKVFPGTKRVAIKAILAGGALPHRLGLSETVLIFPQHMAFLGGLEACLKAIPQIKAEAKEKKIAVEVTDQKQAELAALAGVDLIQVDKMPPEELGRLVLAVRALVPSILVAAAGGVNEQNADAYTAAGADVLVLSFAYWAKPADIGVVLEPLT